MLNELGKRAPSSSRPDPWIAKAQRLQTALDEAGDDVARYIAYETAGPVGMAFDIWDEKVGSGQPGCRYEIEARILARQPYADITKQLAVPEESIEAYERIFFNVKDRLNNPGYIIHQVIGEKIHKPMTDPDFGILLKAYAYFSQSAELVNALVSTFPPDATAGDINSYLAADGRFSTRRKAALAARMMGLDNGLNKFNFLEINTKLIEAEQEAGMASPEAGLISNFQNILVQLPMKIGKKGEIIEGRSSELKAIEMLNPDQVVDDYPDFKYSEDKSASD